MMAAKEKGRPAGSPIPNCVLADATESIALLRILQMSRLTRRSAISAAMAETLRPLIGADRSRVCAFVVGAEHHQAADTRRSHCPQGDFLCAGCHFTRRNPPNPAFTRSWAAARPCTNRLSHRVTWPSPCKKSPGHSRGFLLLTQINISNQSGNSNEAGTNQRPGRCVLPAKFLQAPQ